MVTPTPPLAPLTPLLDFDFGLGQAGGEFSLAFGVEAGAAGLSGGLFELSDVDRVSQPLVQIRPFSPAHARRRGIED